MRETYAEITSIKLFIQSYMNICLYEYYGCLCVFMSYENKVEQIKQITQVLEGKVWKLLIGEYPLSGANHVRMVCSKGTDTQYHQLS